jgi:hypothetical protein
LQQTVPQGDFHLKKEIRLTVDESDIDVEVYKPDFDKNRFFVKVIFRDLGMFINSFKVLPSKIDGQDFWVDPPSHRQGSQWKKSVEFNKGEPLWYIIEKKCLKAVKDEIAEEARVSGLKDNSELSDVPF